jgi:hypothetical protein
LDIQAGVTLESTVAVSSNQLSAQLNGETIVLNLQSGVYFGLTDVAAHIWSLVQQPTTCAAVVAAILAEYEIDPSQAEADVMQFVEKMQGLGLIHVRA